MDMDYISKLTDKEKDFLSRFVTNHYSADFRDRPLVKTKKGKRKIYNENNARNRDLYVKIEMFSTFFRLQENITETDGPQSSTDQQNKMSYDPTESIETALDLQNILNFDDDVE